MDNDIVLEPIERRVLGTLIEKCLTTPDYYPMTAKALVAGCNQKNNREPVSAWTDDDVQGGLASLQLKRMVMAVRPDGGHAIRWRHELDRKWAIQGRELAVLGELLLRGPQTEGELRARASRMGAFPEIETLHEMLELLRARTPPLAMRLSPEGAIRGVRHCHLLYPPAELAEVIASEGAAPPESSREAGSAAAPGSASALQARVAALESRLARVEQFLSAELGATFPATDIADE